MRIKDMPIIERPREKLLKYGKENLTDLELLSIIIKTGTKDRSVKDVSYDIYERFNNIKNFNSLNVENLTSIKGIGKVKAIELIACVELGKRIYLNANEIKKNRYRTAGEIYDDMKYLFYDKKQEYFYCLYFNVKNELIERKLLFMGTVNKSLVHPRDIFREAYLLNASSIVCLHNHPSGDVIPSRDDISFTENLVDLGKMNGIYVKDHIVIGNNSYYSFYEENIIDF